MPHTQYSGQALSSPLAGSRTVTRLVSKNKSSLAPLTVLGVVGAGGLGQMLAFHMGLFQMGETSSILIAMMLLVAAVDLSSYAVRRVLAR